jgi:1,4-alpha-glucan branching enzyme
MPKSTFGSFTFVLHSHLPYVLSHGKWPHGTEWLCEAAAETYIPLLDALNRLVEKGISPKLTLGLTPVLCEMLADPGFVSELQDYLATKEE